MDKGTAIRLIFFVLSWVNVAAAEAGLYHLPKVSEEGVAIVVTFIVTVVTYWKNNNHTKAAIQAQKTLDNLKKK